MVVFMAATPTITRTAGGFKSRPMVAIQSVPSGTLVWVLTPQVAQGLSKTIRLPNRFRSVWINLDESLKKSLMHHFFGPRATPSVQKKII
jgi:hypothetical protein